MIAWVLFLGLFVMALSSPTEELRRRRLAILFLIVLFGLLMRLIRV